MIIDLTHTLNNNTPVYPNTFKARFEQDSSIDNDGFAELKLTMCSHTGTHVDAPAHIFNNSKSLDKFDISKFIGRATVLDCSNIKEISLEFIQQHEKLIKELNFVLFYTSWQNYWHDKRYFNDFPVLSKAATEYLVKLKNLKGIGFDAISADKITDADLPNHKILLSNEVLIIENLTKIDKLVLKDFELNCIPLKIENADGAPARVFARLL